MRSGQRHASHTCVRCWSALVVLLAATALSVYKPRGLTRYGQRKQRERGEMAGNEATLYCFSASKAFISAISCSWFTTIPSQSFFTRGSVSDDSLHI